MKQLYGGPCGDINLTTETVFWSVFRYNWYVASSQCRTQPHSRFEDFRHFDHVTDALVSLYWLRVPESDVYKIAVLTFKVLYGIAPEYLRPVVRVANLPGQQSLRSAGTNHLVVLPFKLSTIGMSLPPVASPRVWNSLPADITSAVVVDLSPMTKNLSISTVVYSSRHLILCTLAVDLAVTFT